MENTGVYSISSLNSAENQLLLKELIAKAKSGDQGAFTEIYNLYFKKIYRFIYYRVSHKETAEDLAEDVFVKAYSKIFGINNDSSFEGWLYQIARNTVIDYYREKNQNIPLDEVENLLEYESNIVEILDLQQQQKIFIDLLKELGQDQQLVIKLKFLENLENNEIAEILNKKEGAIRVIQHRAILRLQELIENLNSKNSNEKN